MQGSFEARSVENPLSAASMRAFPVKETLESQPQVLRIDESLSPTSIDSVVIVERDSKNATASPINSVDCLEADQVILVIHSSILN